MSSNSKVQETGLSRRYTLELRKQLAPGRSASLRPAELLGLEALAAGLNTFDLVKMHASALATALSVSTGAAKSNRVATGSASFFFKALMPFGNAHRTAIKSNGNLTRANATLRERTKQLAALRRQLEREIGQRESAQKALATSEAHCGQLLASSERLQEQLRRLSHEILYAHEEERKQISRELHDEIGQTLTAVNVRLATLTKEATVSTTSLKRKIASTQRLLEKSLNRVHRFARELRPPLLDDLGLVAALKSYLTDFSKRTHIEVHFKTFASIEELRSDVRTVLYRVAQEAFTNVDRHARANLLEVTFQRLGDNVRMEIHDDGKSFKVADVSRIKPGLRLGLLGMRERTEMVGGTFSIESEPSKGTTVIVLVPFGDRLTQRRPRRLSS